MRRSLFIVAVFILMAVSGRDAQAAKFGTQDSLQLLQELTTRGPQGEALALGYVTTTHFFFLPYNMTGDYVLIVAGGGRDLHGRAIDVYHRLPKEKIEEMQRAGELPNPLPPYRHTIVNYLWPICCGGAFRWCFSSSGSSREAPACTARPDRRSRLSVRCSPPRHDEFGLRAFEFGVGVRTSGNSDLFGFQFNVGCRVPGCHVASTFSPHRCDRTVARLSFGERGRGENRRGT